MAALALRRARRAGVLRVGYEPRIVGSDVGTTPIFNWMLYGYGIPALSFWLAGCLLRQRADDQPARMVDSAAILFTVLTAFLEIRHYIYSGDIYYRVRALTEVALQVSGGLAMVIGLERLRERTGSVVHNAAALLIAAFCLVAIVLGLLLFVNPWLNGTDVGGLFINLNLLGYAIPAMLAGALALMTRQTRPQGYRTVAAVTAVVLALMYLSLQVARFYQGPRLSIGPVTGAEGYTYSAVWLGFGVVLLIVGILLRSQPVRLCSAAVVIATVVKVFLLDHGGAHRHVARAVLHRPRAGVDRDRTAVSAALVREETAGGAGNAACDILRGESVSGRRGALSGLAVQCPGTRAKWRMMSCAVASADFAALSSIKQSARGTGTRSCWARKPRGPSRC